MSKTFQGILLIRPAQCPDLAAMTRLWVHENMRVFHDRLVSAEDKAFYCRMVHENLKARFEWAPSYEETFENGPPVMYCDFLRLGATGEDKVRIFVFFSWGPRSGFSHFLYSCIGFCIRKAYSVVCLGCP